MEGPIPHPALFRYFLPRPGPPPPHVERWISPPRTRLAVVGPGCGKFLIGGVAEAPGEKSSTDGGPRSRRSQSRTPRWRPPGIQDARRRQIRPLQVRVKGAADEVGGRGGSRRGGPPSLPACLTAAQDSVRQYGRAQSVRAEAPRLPVRSGACGGRGKEDGGNHARF